MSDYGLGTAPSTGAARRLSLALLVLVCGVILIITLAPTGGVRRDSSELCLICGDRGLADAVLNVILFLPLGGLAAAAGFRRARVYLVAALFSAGIECTQVFMASRDGSLGDILFNTLGFAVGVQLFRARTYWLRSPASWSSALSFAALYLGFIALTAYLFQPSYPDSKYFSQWTPRLGRLERYGGRVLDARIGSLPLPQGPLANSEAVGAALRSGVPLEVSALAGPATSKLVSLLSVADEKQRQVFLLGPTGPDLVFRFRTRARAARLDSPDLRLSDALLGLRSGERMRVRVWRQDRRYCLQLNDRMGCRTGYTVGRGWALLLATARGPAWMRRVIDGVWLALLVFPVGFWAPGGWRLIMLGAGLVLAVGSIPLAIGLVSAPGSELLATLLGLAVGRRVGRRVRAVWGVPHDSLVRAEAKASADNLAEGGAGLPARDR